MFVYLNVFSGSPTTQIGCVTVSILMVYFPRTRRLYFSSVARQETKKFCWSTSCVRSSTVRSSDVLFPRGPYALLGVQAIPTSPPTDPDNDIGYPFPLFRELLSETFPTLPPYNDTYPPKSQ